jgi:glycosyltransferase involved in cell wall biosynthesis
MNKIATRTLRILHVAATSTGGIGFNLWMLAKHINRTDFELSFALPADSHFYDKIANEDVNVHPLTISRSPLKLENIRGFCDLWRIIKSGNYDIVHTHTAVGGFIGRLIAWINKVPVILWTIHGWSFDYPIGTPLRRCAIRAIEKFLDRLTDHYVAISGNMQEVGINAGISARGKVTLIYHGIETDDPIYGGNQTEAETKNGNPVIGTVGRLEPQKAIDDFLRAARIVKERFPQVSFMVVGDGPLREELQRLAITLGIEGSVLFAGWQENVAEYLAAMDIFCLPSRWEGFGIILLEAMAMRMPIVATRVGGVPEIVEEGKSGILVSPGNPAELADGLCRLLSDANMRKEIGYYNAKKVKTFFNVKDMINKYEEMYKGFFK